MTVTAVDSIENVHAADKGIGVDTEIFPLLLDGMERHVVGVQKTGYVLLAGRLLGPGRMALVAYLIFQRFQTAVACHHVFIPGDEPGAAVHYPDPADP
jgi:hypothetical protein